MPTPRAADDGVLRRGDDRDGDPAHPLIRQQPLDLGRRQGYRRHEALSGGAQDQP
jgi:hypothetical protein